MLHGRLADPPGGLVVRSGKIGPRLAHPRPARVRLGPGHVPRLALHRREERRVERIDVDVVAAVRARHDPLELLWRPRPATSRDGRPGHAPTSPDRGSSPGAAVPRVTADGPARRPRTSLAPPPRAPGRTALSSRSPRPRRGHSIGRRSRLNLTDAPGSSQDEMASRPELDPRCAVAVSPRGGPGGEAVDSVRHGTNRGAGQHRRRGAAVDAPGDAGRDRLGAVRVDRCRAGGARLVRSRHDLLPRRVRVPAARATCRSTASSRRTTSTSARRS